MWSHWAFVAWGGAKLKSCDLDSWNLKAANAIWFSGSINVRLDESGGRDRQNHVTNDPLTLLGQTCSRCVAEELPTSQNWTSHAFTPSAFGRPSENPNLMLVARNAATSVLKTKQQTFKSFSYFTVRMHNDQISYLRWHFTIMFKGLIYHIIHAHI